MYVHGLGYLKRNGKLSRYHRVKRRVPKLRRVNPSDLVVSGPGGTAVIMSRRRRILRRRRSSMY